MRFTKTKKAFIKVESYWIDSIDFYYKDEINQIFTPLSRSSPIFQNVTSLLKHNIVKDTLTQMIKFTILSFLGIVIVACMYIQYNNAVIMTIGLLMIILDILQSVAHIVVLSRDLHSLSDNTDISISFCSEYNKVVSTDSYLTTDMDYPLCLIYNKKLFITDLYVVKASWSELFSEAF